MSSLLLRGQTKSCGCLWRDIIKTTSKKHGACCDHKMTRLYNIWMNMRDRCNDTSNLAYKNYGGRGIKVCDAWENSFNAFKDWAYESGYSDNLTIDRIEVDGNYSPENCRWATRKEQSNNKRNNRTLTINGETKTLSEWSDISGISVSTIWARINVYGWDINDAVFKPVRGTQNG